MLAQINISALGLLNYFASQLLAPLLLFSLLLLLLWYLQARLALHIYYRLLLPLLRQNRLAYYLIGWPAVASHEILGHGLVAALTGSSPSLTPITPEHSETRISFRNSAFGYLSALLATLAPCFAPPLLLLGLFSFLFPEQLQFLSFNPPAASLSFLSNASLLLTYFFFGNWLHPSLLLFLYSLLIISLTAGSSLADWRLIIQQTKQRWHFALFLFLLFAALMELARILLSLDSAERLFYPLLVALLTSFFLMLLGLTLALLIRQFLLALAPLRNSFKLFVILVWLIIYFSLTSYIVLPFPYFSSLLGAWAAAFALAFALRRF